RDPTQLTLLHFHSFFFQAEDGIRAFHVTGVQTCALPISQVIVIIKADINDSNKLGREADEPSVTRGAGLAGKGTSLAVRKPPCRSEERRVGKEGSAWLAPDHV